MQLQSFDSPVCRQGDGTVHGGSDHLQRTTTTTTTGGRASGERPPPGISAASFQFEEAEERSVREADREKHDCSSILLVAVASAVVLLYAIAKQENGG